MGVNILTDLEITAFWPRYFPTLLGKHVWVYLAIVVIGLAGLYSNFTEGLWPITNSILFNLGGLILRSYSGW